MTGSVKRIVIPRIVSEDTNLMGEKHLKKQENVDVIRDKNEDVQGGDRDSEHGDEVEVPVLDQPEKTPYIVRDELTRDPTTTESPSRQVEVEGSSESYEDYENGDGQVKVEGSSKQCDD